MPFSKFRLHGQRRLSDAVVESLGGLERKVMDIILSDGESNVTQLCTKLDQPYAYTTVMTTLDRLFKKGLLDRRKQGRAYVYTAKLSLADMERGVAEDVIDRLFENSFGRAEPVLACIVDSVSGRDRQLLDELERLVKQKRLELEGKE